MFKKTIVPSSVALAAALIGSQAIAQQTAVPAAPDGPAQVQPAPGAPVPVAPTTAAPVQPGTTAVPASDPAAPAATDTADAAPAAPASDAPVTQTAQPAPAPVQPGTPAPAQSAQATPSPATTAPATTAPATTGASAQVVAFVDQQFATVDGDKDGALTQVEFEGWIGKLKTAELQSSGKPVNATEVKTYAKNAFLSADKDANKKVTKAEVTQFLSQA